MFESTAPFTLFDYFRVPYELDRGAARNPSGIASLTPKSGETRLWWPTASAFGAHARGGFYRVDSIPIFGRVLDNTEATRSLQRIGRGWRSSKTVRDARGTAVASIWTDENGSTFLPFDPNELIENILLERYQAFLGPPTIAKLTELGRVGYYRARAFLPRGIQMSLRRTFSRVQSRVRFPRWPVETALHDFYDFLFDLLSRVAEGPVPFIAPWPGGHSWALVLTHDVEGPSGYANVQRLLDVELDAGYRSSWNFVPCDGYNVEPAVIAGLSRDGCEIGVHGLRHDGRDLSSLAVLRQRLPIMRSYAERWQAKGFRSPGTLRSAKLMPLLGFDYDSSYSDTAPFEPQAGGCCSWLPYMIDELVELPITLTQDHTIFELLRREDERLWVEKARFLRERGGMALILTHPDYIDNPRLLSSYRRFLEEFADDASAWKVLPAEVSSWWRRRAASTLREIDGEWRIVGPAEEEGRVALTTPQLQPV
jgi:peptidoglycan/xylan/chitin deacetylase (PgdA/CDA1 family)